MVIVLCGPAGAGKSTVGKLLAQRLAAPIYRPFRSAGDGHTPGASEPDLARLGVEVNTWREDLYTADVLATLVPGQQALRPRVILDRSMPSALAYCSLTTSCHGLDTQRKRDDMARLWGRRMHRAGAFIFHVWADSAICVARAPRFDTLHAMREMELINRYIDVSGVPNDFAINNGMLPLERVVDKMVERLAHHGAVAR